jgi:hypothetical protein
MSRVWSIVGTKLMTKSRFRTFSQAYRNHEWVQNFELPACGSIKEFCRWVHFSQWTPLPPNIPRFISPKRNSMRPFFGLEEVILMVQHTCRRIDESQLTRHLQQLLTSQDSESNDYWSDHISKQQASAALQIFQLSDFTVSHPVTADRWESMRLSYVPLIFLRRFQYGIMLAADYASDDNIHAFTDVRTHLNATSELVR